HAALPICGPRCRETDVDFLHCRRRSRTFDCSLSVLPPCRALAEERVHAFLAVVREEVAGNGMSSHTLGIAGRQIELKVEELLARPDDCCRLRRDTARQRLDFGIERLGRHDAIDESDL